MEERYGNDPDTFPTYNPMNSLPRGREPWIYFGWLRLYNEILNFLSL